MAKIKLLACIVVLVVQLTFGEEEPPVSNESQLQLIQHFYLIRVPFYRVMLA